MIYLNKLVIKKATLDDAGMYICFVTNSGFGDLTYKSMTLRVQNRKLIYFFTITLFRNKSFILDEMTL